MLELKKGVDILTEVGGIRSIDEARKLFQEKLDQKHLARLGKIKNKEALEISSSTYVMHSGDILYRHAYEKFDDQVERASLSRRVPRTQGAH